MKRLPRQATVQFIAMLRALERSVASHGVSHAELERRLCDWIIQGRKAEMALRENPGEQDRKNLQVLAERKTLVELSGLARMDGRRDRAGGQRIGELVNGKCAPGAMPPRRRVDVCVDVLLVVLEENDPDGYARGMYGTRESWRNWWLQADQGHLPDIGDRSLTVWGYLDVALEQLTETRYRETGLGSGRDSRVGQAVSESPELGQAEQRVAEVRAERDAAVEEARRAAELLDQVRSEAEQRMAEVRAERDAAAGKARDRRTRRRLFRVVSAAAVLIATAGVVLWVAGVGRSPAPFIVELASPAQYATTAQQPVFPFAPALPAGRDWMLHITMNVTAKDNLSSCTYGLQITTHIEADGRALPSFSSSPGQTTISYATDLGERGSRSLRLVVTHVSTDPTCTLVIDPTGSEATG